MATRSEINDYSVDELCEFVIGRLGSVVGDPEDLADKLRENRITGKIIFFQLAGQCSFESLNNIKLISVCRGGVSVAGRR